MSNQEYHHHLCLYHYYIVINFLGVVRSDVKMKEEDQEHQDAIRQHQEAQCKQQIHREQQRQDTRQEAIRQQQEEAKATQIQREQQHQDAIEQQRQKTIRQQQEEAKATQIQHEQQGQDAIEQQRQETQCDASQNFQDTIEQQRQERQHASQNLLLFFQGGFSVRNPPKVKSMEDRLSPKAQDLLKKSAKVKSASNDLVVEKRKERKRASESKSRKKGFVEGLRVDTEAQQQRAPSADLHAREMDTIDEIEADLIREVQEVQYNFPSPTSLEDGV